MPLQRYPTYDFFGRVSGYRVAELPLDVQQQADECERQKQNAIRSLANERQAEAEAAQREAAQRLKDQQLARERSPDNVCATPNMARAVMLEFDGMEGFQNRGIKAIDVEHMVTRSPPGSEFPSCHGVFVTNRGLRLEGTLSLRQNIAGDAIASWRMEP